MKDSLLTTIPFSGFYGSWHEDEIDTTLNRMFEDDQGNAPSMFDDAWETVSYEFMHRTYAKYYCERFADEFDLSLKFDELSSPREYNFTTDRVFAYVSRQDVAKMALAVRLSALDAHIRDKFTSRSGFISGYPNTLAEWPDCLGDWDHNQMGTLVEAYVRHVHGEFDQMAEFDLMEYDRCNGEIDSMIYDNMNDHGHRLVAAASYLRERTERQYR